MFLTPFFFGPLAFLRESWFGLRLTAALGSSHPSSMHGERPHGVVGVTTGGGPPAG